MAQDYHELAALDGRDRGSELCGRLDCQRRPGGAELGLDVAGWTQNVAGSVAGARINERFRNSRCIAVPNSLRVDVIRVFIRGK